jgi:hypothetical protein
MLTIKKVEVFGPDVQGLREPPGGPEGVRSTERSEPRKVATLRSRGTPNPLIISIKRYCFLERASRCMGFSGGV